MKSVFSLLEKFQKDQDKLYIVQCVLCMHFMHISVCTLYAYASSNNLERLFKILRMKPAIKFLKFCPYLQDIHFIFLSLIFTC